MKRWARAWPWRCRQAVFSVCPVVCLQRALPRVTLARGPGLYLSAPGQCCALIVMRVSSGPAAFSHLFPLPHCPSQPFSSVLFSFSVHLHWSGVSRPVKYINEFLAPALCTQVTHCTLEFCSWCFQCMVLPTNRPSDTEVSALCAALTPAPR